MINNICSDLLQPLPSAQESGFFEKHGKKYGTIGAWAKVLPISEPSVSLRIKANRLKSVKGKHIRGSIYDFYSEPDVLSACADLLAKKESEEPNPKAA